jgi:hypothetical protein
MEQEIQAARDKLAARFGNATQIGGKGTPLSYHKYFYRHSEKKEEAC